jgi:predicted flap endonuclease-1-like 5' DNA nuclease
MITLFAVLGVTVVGFSLPPGDMIFNLLGIPEITYSILGFSGQLFVHGIISGIFWGTIMLMVYYLGYRANKRERVIDLTEQTSGPKPYPVSLKSHSVRKSSIKKRKTYVPLDQSIETIEGIGPRYGSRLRSLGIVVVEDLLTMGSTRTGRRFLADKVNVSPMTIHKWVNKADFLRIKGIGRQYSSLLESAGVTTILDLSRRNSLNLFEKLKETNKERNLVRRIPTYNMIDSWIQDAKKLERIVTY